MRQSSLLAILLTLFTGLLILTATVFFMFQGRATAHSQIGALRDERAGLSVTVASIEGELATAEATREWLAQELVSRENQLTAMQQQVADLTVTLSQQQSALAQAEAREREIRERPPLVRIVMPEDGQAIRPGSPISVVVSATDPAGVIALYLTVNGEAVTNVSGDAEPLRTLAESWAPPGDGDFVFSAIATNVHGRTSEPVTATITIFDLDAINSLIRARVEANVSQIRGLQPITPVLPTLLTPIELRQRLEADFEEDYSFAEARQDAIVYSAFDFFSRDFDLYNFWLDLYSEQIAGYYSTETAEFVVISEGERLGPSEQWTHAHEFVHALQDQHFNLGALTDDEIDAEARTAIRALAEGEATLVQILYLDYFNDAEIGEIFGSFNGDSAQVLNSAPPVLRASLEFPYNAGFEFVRYLYQRGEFAAIDAAWENPPVSTEQILHPERYLAGDRPIPVTLAPLTGTLGAGWQLLDEDIFGEFFLREYLRQQLNADEVDVAATGWGGDRYAVYWHDEDEALVMVLALAWDTPADREQFSDGYSQYATRLTGQAAEARAGNGRCWQAADVICLYEMAEQTVIVRAPNLTTAARIAAVQRVRP